MLLVVALALRDDAGRLLLQQRPAGKHHAGLWEFPGGKVENGENPRFALVREIAEELSFGLEPAMLEPLAFADESALSGEPSVTLLLYGARVWSGEIRGLEGQEWRWLAPEEAAALPLAPLDRTLLERLSL